MLTYLLNIIKVYLFKHFIALIIGETNLELKLVASCVSLASLESKSHLAAQLPPTNALHLHFSQQSQ